MNRLAVYFFCTFVWSWSFWVPAVLIFRAGPATTERLLALLPFVLLGAYGPTIVAILLAGYTEGRAGLVPLLRKYLVWRVAPVWYLFALFGPAAFTCAAIGWHLGQGGSVGPFDPGGLVMVLPTLLAALPFGPLAEELGWRGYALPRMETLTSPFLASLWLGVVWTFWHTPLLWAPAGTTISGLPVDLRAVLTYLAFVTGLSFLFTWLADHTRGSVLLAVLLHLSVNAGLIFLFFPGMAPGPEVIGPSATQRHLLNLSIVPLWLFVGLIVASRPGRWFQRPGPLGASGDGVS